MRHTAGRLSAASDGLSSAPFTRKGSDDPDDLTSASTQQRQGDLHGGWA